MGRLFIGWLMAQVRTSIPIVSNMSRGRSEICTEFLDEESDAFDRVVVVGGTGDEAHFQVEPVGGSHRGGRGVEVEGGAASGDSAIENGLGEGTTEMESAGGRANPEAFHLPGIRNDRGVCGECAPGDEAGGLAIGEGDERTAALGEIALRQVGGLFFERTEAEAGGTGLGDDEAAVFKQESAGVGELCG